MSYAFVQDTPATWDTYLEIADALAAPAPEGLVVHVAGPTEEGFRMIGIWESQQAWNLFRADHLRGMLEGFTAGSRLQPTYRGLDVAHLLRGPATLPLATAGRREK